MYSFEVVVLGATGAVGRVLVSELQQRGATVVPASRSTGHDLTTHPEALASLTATAELTINATGLELPEVARHSRAPFLDISASASYLLELAAQGPPAGVVLNVGLSPGLSTGLVRQVSSGPDDEVDVAVLLGVGEHHGPAARAWTARLLGTSFTTSDDGVVRNLTAPRTLAFPGHGRRRLVRADFPEHAFPQVAGAKVRSYFGLTSRAATASLRLGSWLPRLAGPLLSAPVPGSHAWALAAQSRRTGRWAGAGGVEQSVATAQLTALTALAAIKAGVRGAVVHQPDLISLTDIATLPAITLDCRGDRAS